MVVSATHRALWELNPILTLRFLVDRPHHTRSETVREHLHVLSTWLGAAMPAEILQIHSMSGKEGGLDVVFN
jgi:hypothetical protein